MSNWHWSFDMESVNKRIGWGKYRELTLWQVVLCDANYIKWILENPNIYVSQTLNMFLAGAIQCENAEKKRLFFNGIYDLMQRNEKNAREEARKLENQQAKERREAEEARQRQLAEKQAEYIKKYQSTSAFLNNPENVLLFSKEGKILWEKKRSYQDGTMRREKYVSLYNDVEIILHKESYRGKDYKWIPTYFFTFELEGRLHEVKEPGIKGLWEYLDCLETKKEAAQLQIRNAERKREEERRANMPRKEIEFVDVVVKCNTIACEENHHVEDVVAVFMVAKNGVVREVEVPAGYCRECECYFILEETYKAVQGRGRLLCQLITVTVFNKLKNGQMEYTDRWADESPLKIAGYSVDAKTNLSEWERHTILEYVIESGILTKNRVLQYLDGFVEFRKHREDMQAAVDKWCSDRKYIASYKVGSAKLVKVGKLTRKVRIQIH